jgi:hypothetical protein
MIEIAIDGVVAAKRHTRDRVQPFLPSNFRLTVLPPLL